MSKCQEWRGNILRMCLEIPVRISIDSNDETEIGSALPSNFGSLGRLALEDRGGARYVGLRMELDKGSKN